MKTLAVVLTASLLYSFARP